MILGQASIVHTELEIGERGPLITASVSVCVKFRGWFLLAQFGIKKTNKKKNNP